MARRGRRLGRKLPKFPQASLLFLLSLPFTPTTIQYQSPNLTQEKNLSKDTQTVMGAGRSRDREGAQIEGQSHQQVGKTSR